MQHENAERLRVAPDSATERSQRLRTVIPLSLLVRCSSLRGARRVGAFRLEEQCGRRRGDDCSVPDKAVRRGGHRTVASRPSWQRPRDPICACAIAGRAAFLPVVALAGDLGAGARGIHIYVAMRPKMGGPPGARAGRTTWLGGHVKRQAQEEDDVPRYVARHTVADSLQSPTII